MLLEINAEAVRLNRSASWIVQAAWKIAKGRIYRLHSVSEMTGEMREGLRLRPPSLTEAPSEDQEED